VLNLTSEINDRSIFTTDITRDGSEFLGPVFPVINLWSQWKNTVLFSCFSEYLHIDKLRTNHKKIFYCYNLNWNTTTINFEWAQKTVLSPDVVLVRNENHASVIMDVFGRNAIVVDEEFKITEDFLQSLFEE